MDEFKELQDLWQNSTPAPAPDAGKIIAAVSRQRRRMVAGVAFSMLALAGTLWMLTRIFMDYQPRFMTTRFSIVLIALVVLAGILVQGSTLPLLTKPVREDTDNMAMLASLKKLQIRQKRVNTTFLSAYYIFLSTGMAIYLFEFAWGHLLFGTVAYTLTFGWILFAWYYIRPRKVSRQNAAINRMIGHLERLQHDWEEQE